MRIRSLLTAVLAAGTLAVSVPASATLTNWYVDTDGAGGGAMQLVSDYIDLNGQAYVRNSFAAAPAPGVSFNFEEAASFISTLADGSTALNTNLSSIFLGTGTGVVGGGLTFAPGGSLVVMSGATTIGTFSLVAGSANLNSAGGVLPNGEVSLIFEALSLASGYFFDSSMVDLTTYAPGTVVLGFATTNAKPLNGPIQNNAAGNAVIAAFNGAFGLPDVTHATTINQVTDLYISNNGQFQLQVPEPSMLSLLGLAFLGLGFASRRRSSL